MKKEFGFTLMELLVGLAVVAILASVAVPLFNNWASSQRLISDTRAVRSALEFAKINAIKNRSEAGVLFEPDSYIVFLDDGTTNPGNMDYDADDTVLKSFQISGTTTLANASFDISPNVSGAWIALFNSRGLAPIKNGHMTVNSNKGKQKQVTLTVAGITKVE